MQYQQIKSVIGFSDYGRVADKARTRPISVEKYSFMHDDSEWDDGNARHDASSSNFV